VAESGDGGINGLLGRDGSLSGDAPSSAGRPGQNLDYGESSPTGRSDGDEIGDVANDRMVDARAPAWLHQTNQPRNSSGRGAFAAIIRWNHAAR
jgi:hypothetical protein